MKNVFFLVMVLTIGCLAVSKPMEAITNYNIIMVHGAYGSEKGFSACDTLKEAYEYGKMLENGATLGGYGNNDRITKWLSKNVLEEPDIGDERNALNSYIYNWRSFSNPANSSHNNAYELGDRTWNKDGKFGKRRALFEEAQEVKAVFPNSNTGRNDSGQIALESIRQNSNLYRQLASRYILIAHSMGGVVSREYVQGDFYDGDVDKIITLDSPHEGTGALNMQVTNEGRDFLLGKEMEAFGKAIPLSLAVGIPLVCLNSKTGIKAGLFSLGLSFVLGQLTVFGTRAASPEIYFKDDPLVHYVDPYQTGFETIDSLNKLDYRKNLDSLPMFRILASQNGMTFSDPKHINYGWLDYMRYLLPDNYTLPIANLVAMLSSSDDETLNYVNALTGTTIGIAGIPIQENGSSIVPAASSEGRNVGILTDEHVDVKREYFNAAPYASSVDEGWLLGVTIATDAILVIDAVWAKLDPGTAELAKIAVGMAAAGAFAGKVTSILLRGIDDLAESHQIPLYSDNLDTMKVAKNSFIPIGSSAGSSYAPYLMEDFLYEKPFVNLVLNDSRTMDSLSKMGENARNLSTLNHSCFYGADVVDTAQNCETGLYGADGETVDITGERNYSSFKVSPLKFKTSSDWSKMGVKIDRWERVDGLKPDGGENPGGVPIRHVERYEVPAITVDNFIEKYSFVVDDLMPHRLRQIRMNFNYQEEIAWECDITKPEGDGTACSFYKRKAGKGLDLDTTIGARGLVPHPVKKNGQFDFEPRKFGIKNLSAIQKDNQNTVTISTVNKIGLSNIQRFYYLFKASKTLFESSWPVEDIAVNRIADFRAYGNLQDYQDMVFVGATDSIWKCDGVNCGTAIAQYARTILSEDGDFREGRYYKSSRVTDDTVSDGEYVWRFDTKVKNGADTVSDFYNFHFLVDRTGPVFSITTDAAVVNPDSGTFVARFNWIGADSKDSARGPDIRAMRWILEHSTGKNSAGNELYETVVELPYMYDVSARSFAVAWNQVPSNVRDSLKGGLYRVYAEAIDYALPSRDAYDRVNSMISRIMEETIDSSEWKSVKGLGLNVGEAEATFFVDKEPPSLISSEISGVLRDSIYHVGGEDLLSISYGVKESLFDRDSAAITIAWEFIHRSDFTKVDRAGDSVWVKNADSTGGRWTESASLRLEDGDYIVRYRICDQAGNCSADRLKNTIRIDRTAPKIWNLVSSHLVYAEGVRNFSANMKVDESNDVVSNRKGVSCKYQVTGADADTEWRDVVNNGLRKDSITFNIDPGSVGVQRGVRYLSVSCRDSVGNISVRSDVFHVGDRFPEIISPKDDREFISTPVIPIVGVAAPSLTKYELTTAYRLRYRVSDSVEGLADAEWKTDSIFVTASNRSKDNANISRLSQSNEGVLGYLYRGGIEDSLVEIELSVRGCDKCEWLPTTSIVTLGSVKSSGYPKAVFDVNPMSLTVGSDSLINVDLHLEGQFDGSYALHLYAVDDEGRGLKDWSEEKVFFNPYYGIPQNTNESRGIWFYEDDSLYHLEWKGLPDTSEIDVTFDASVFGKTCVNANGDCPTEGCEVFASSLEYGNLLQAVEGYLSDYPEWMPIARADSVMKIKSSSGHLVMNSKGAFRVSGTHLDSLNKIPVYFGKSTEVGFFWVNGGQSLDALFMGWTVNPNNYGLRFSWNGVSAMGGYPVGNVNLIAEITENKASNPFVYVDSKKLQINLAGVKIALQNTLPDYIALRKGDSVDVSVLGKMVVNYGILNRKADVTAYIVQDDKKYEIMRDTSVRANSSPVIDSVVWDGTLNGVAVEPGMHKLVIEARAVDDTSHDEAIAYFNVEYAPSLTPVNVVDNDSSSTNIVIPEAFVDEDGHKRYEPVADYLLDLSLRGSYLPEERRQVKIREGGSQKALGYRAERYSLGIRRWRDTLDLVLLLVLDAKLDKNDCDSGDPFLDGEEHIFLQKNDFKFYRGGIDTISFRQTIGSIGNGRAFSVNDTSVLRVYAFPKYRTEDTENALYKDISSAFAKFSVNLPMPTRDHSGDVALKFGAWSDSIETGCVASDEKGCEYGAEKLTENYNPNAGLFKLELVPEVINKCPDGMDFAAMTEFVSLGLDECPKNGTYYYYDLGQVRNGSSCYNNDKGFESISFKVVLEIPDAYWDAGFGYDNLVTRTIRFDPENMTLYGSDSYMRTIQEANTIQDTTRKKNYFDGSRWIADADYGKLTPFEVQHLPFISASEIQGGKNAFLFADEKEGYEYPSSFTLKFYNDTTAYDVRHFVAHVYGDSLNGGRFYKGMFSNQEPLVTPALRHGSVDFFVGMERTFESCNAVLDYRKEIPYPASVDDVPKSTDSIKYYSLGSRIHYYKGDYTENQWLEKFTTTRNASGYIKNLLNSGVVDTSGPLKYLEFKYKPDSLGVLDINPDSVDGGSSSSERIVLVDSLFDESTRKFMTYIGDSSSTVMSSINWEYKLVDNDASVEIVGDTMFVLASDTNFHQDFRRTRDFPHVDIPSRMSSSRIEASSLYKNNDSWLKNPVVDHAEIQLLDGRIHSHLRADADYDYMSDIMVSFMDTVGSTRPDELVEIRSYLMAGNHYRLSYLKDGRFNYIMDTVALNDGMHHLAWFNVNRLQGNTTLMLTWGDETSAGMFYIRYDLYVGKRVAVGEATTVQSLFGELSVSFPVDAFSSTEDVTVRTVRMGDSADYKFEVFGDIALTGPVVEVLPRHDFGEGPYPRVQMVISRAEMDRAGVTPQTLKLFKVDFEKGKLVPLTNALYGYLKKDGSPAVGGASADTAGCTSWDDVLCYDGDWAYVMVSAETRTFSVFVAVDSVMADIFNAREDSVDSDSSTYPTEIACRLPQDSLWLGLENGYMAYAVACNQPVRRNISLYLDDSRVVDILMDDSDTLRYDGTRKSGGTIVGKIASGIYDSRIRASSATGGEIQLAGPQVHTDSARPVISEWAVRDSVDVLDRIFEVTARVHDDESGVAKVAIIPVFGTDTLDIVFPEPDGQGNVSAQVRLPRGRLARCFGCRLNLNLLVEDFGRNHDERVFRSDSLYPYPVGLALWYPAREGSGSVAHEFTQGEHDQDLSHVSSPWQSDAGIYFGNYRDYSEASTIVDLGFANAYSFEARLRVGYSDDKWRRVLGFSGVNGLNIELQNRGRALRLVEGANVWNGGSVLSEEKTWNHVVVSVDSQEVRFYVDGALANSVDISGSAVAKMDRELYGKFSFGNDPSVSGSNSSAYSYIGHVADVRMYTESVSSDQVYALYSPVSDDGSPAEIVVASVGDVTGIVGFEKRFSCSVAGNNYYVSDRDDATISVDMAVTQTGAYNVVLYARSTEENDVSVYVGESSLLRGSARFSTVWRAVTVSGVSLNLPSGRRTISVKVPEGVQIAGIALTSGTVASTSIPWGHSSGARKVHTYLRYESGPSPAMLLPRIRMENISGETLDGFSIRYYFRGENPADVAAEAYFPQEYFRTLSVHAESQSLGYVEWNFYDVRLAPGQQAFYGQGPHFGIHNYDWSPWDATDDPSYVDFSDGFSVTSDGFVEDIGIIVLDSDNNLVGGSCVEMEDEISPAASPAIYITLL